MTSGTTSKPSTPRAARTIVAPADLDEDTTARVRELATEVFTMAGCSGLARCDFFVEEADGQSTILLNEINTIPGFTRTSVYAKLWEATGMPYPDLCNRLVELALERHSRSRTHLLGRTVPTKSAISSSQMGRRVSLGGRVGPRPTPCS